MGESKDYMTLPEQNGSVNIAKDVIAAVAVDAVREVEGVAGMMTSMGGVMDLVDKKNAQKGLNQRQRRQPADPGPLPHRELRRLHPGDGGERPEGRRHCGGGHDRL